MHATLCDLITDLVQNAFEAGATETTLKIEEAKRNLTISIMDNGKGMSPPMLEKAKDPFYSDGQKHTHRKVGLGLPFLFQTAEATGGSVRIESEENIGTTVLFRCDGTNLDLPMFGNFCTAATTLMSYGAAGNLKIQRRLNGKGYEVDKAGLQEALGDLNDLDSLTLLKQFMQENEQEIQEQGRRAYTSYPSNFVVSKKGEPHG